MIGAFVGAGATLVILGCLKALPMLENKETTPNICAGCPHAEHHTCDMTHGYCNRSDDSYRV